MIYHTSARTELGKHLTEKEKKHSWSYVICGTIAAVAGFVLVVIGTSVFLKLISNLSSTTADYFQLIGLVMLTLGFGLLGYDWASVPKGKTASVPTPSPRMSVVLTFIATTVIAVMAAWAGSAGSVLWTAVTVGAIGGLVHEIAQSKGTAFFPDTDNKADTDNKSDAKKGTSKSESYLGGLIGIILGGAAGLVALSVSPTPTIVTTQMIATAFAAGVALKGIADSAASAPKTSS